MQGTLIGSPFAPLTAPSQSPVPVGFTPLLNPSGGAREAMLGFEDVSSLPDGCAAAGVDVAGGAGGAAGGAAGGGDPPL